MMHSTSNRAAGTMTIIRYMIQNLGIGMTMSCLQDEHHQFNTDKAHKGVVDRLACDKGSHKRLDQWKKHLR